MEKQILNPRTIRNVLKTLEAEQFVFEYTGNKRNKKFVRNYSVLIDKAFSKHYTLK